VILASSVANNRKVCKLQTGEDGVAENCCGALHQPRSHCIHSALLSPVPDNDASDDNDDGFAELRDFPSSDPEIPDASVTKCVNAVSSSCCRKRRRDLNDSIENEENCSIAGDKASVDVLAMSSVGHETPTSSKQAVKRAKECSECGNAVVRPLIRAVGRRLVRCHSDAVIHQALSTSEEQSNLIGDFSRPHTLPLLSAVKHQDLRSISPDTVR